MPALVDNPDMRKALPLALSGLLMVFIGAYMIIRPDDFLSVVISLLGIYIVFDGVRSVISLLRFRSYFPSFVKTLAAVKTVLNIVLGIVIIALAISNPSALLSAVIYIVAAAFLITAAINFTDCIALSRLGIGYGSLGLESIVSFIVSLILFIFPHFVGSVIMTLFSAIILSSGAVLVYAAILRFMRRDES